MKNTAINTLKYTGIVTLSQYSGSKKIKLLQVHNTGGDSLFEFLTSCLMGDFATARLTRPTKIMLLERINPNDKYDPPVYDQPANSQGFMYLITKPEKISESGSSRVRYSFVIPKETIASVKSSDNLYLGLYTNEAEAPENFAAICELKLANNSIPNAALVVDWDLIISNISNAE